MKFQSLIKYPSIFTLLPYIAGILIAHFIKTKLLAPYLELIILIIVAAAAVTIYYKFQPQFHNARLFITYLILIILVGFLRLDQKINNSSDENLSAIIKDINDRDVILYGSVI